VSIAPINRARGAFLHPANPLNNERVSGQKVNLPFWHPSLALSGKRNSGQKGNLFRRLAKFMFIFRHRFRLLDPEKFKYTGLRL
jgi:hypothetical protein